MIFEVNLVFEYAKDFNVLSLPKIERLRSFLIEGRSCHDAQVTTDISD